MKETINVADNQHRQKIKKKGNNINCKIIIFVIHRLANMKYGKKPQMGILLVQMKKKVARRRLSILK